VSLSLADRFEAKVDRFGEHHVWTGSKKTDGSGKIRVGGRSVTARRVAWELVHGPLAEGVEVKACPDEPACVRIEHLSLRGAPDPAVDRKRRSPRGGGSKTEIRPGVWKLTITAGRYSDGRVRRPRRRPLTQTGFAPSACCPADHRHRTQGTPSSSHSGARPPTGGSVPGVTPHLPRASDVAASEIHQPT
jgi:hypothetical protein